MHAMLMAVLVLPVIGAVLLYFEPWNRFNEVVLHTLGATALVLAGLFLVMLIFARPPTCRVLGGEWDADRGSCINDWHGVLDGEHGG